METLVVGARRGVKPIGACVTREHFPVAVRMVYALYIERTEVDDFAGGKQALVLHRRRVPVEVYVPASIVGERDGAEVLGLVDGLHHTHRIPAAAARGHPKVVASMFIVAGIRVKVTLIIVGVVVYPVAVGVVAGIGYGATVNHLKVGWEHFRGVIGVACL